MNDSDFFGKHLVIVSGTVRRIDTRLLCALHALAGRATVSHVDAVKGTCTRLRAEGLTTESDYALGDVVTSVLQEGTLSGLIKGDAVKGYTLDDAKYRAMGTPEPIPW